MSLLQKIALLNTGDEVVNGDILNRNGQNIANRLFEAGFNVGQHLTVDDSEASICQGLEYLSQHHDAIITTGGLGPTSDDRTRHALAQFLKRDLSYDEASWQKILQRFARLQLTPVESNRQQAYFPQGATVLANENGSAPGCAIEVAGQYYFMLPGPPVECQPMVESYVLPTLVKHFKTRSQAFHKWQVFGIGESELATRFDETVSAFDCQTGYRFHYPYVDVKLFYQPQDKQAILAKAQHTLAPYIICEANNSASGQLITQLNQHPIKIGIDDSVTKGLLTSTITTQQNHQQLFFHQADDLSLEHQFIFTGFDEFWQQLKPQGQTHLTLIYSHKGNIINTVEKSIPYRHQRILQHAVEYICYFMRQSLASCFEKVF